MPKLNLITLSINAQCTYSHSAWNGERLVLLLFTFSHFWMPQLNLTVFFCVNEAEIKSLIF